MEDVLYALFAAPLAGFAIAWMRGRRVPPELRLREEVQAFYSTLVVTAMCLFIWAIAMNDLRRRDPPRPPGPVQLEPRGAR